MGTRLCGLSRFVDMRLAAVDAIVALSIRALGLVDDARIDRRHAFHRGVDLCVAIIARYCVVSSLCLLLSKDAVRALESIFGRCVRVMAH